MDEHYTEVQQVLYRMHGQARPWTRVDIVMMQIMNAFVERLPMDQSVYDVEMEFPPKGYQ